MRNPFPRWSHVELLNCDNPACPCGVMFDAGEDGRVINARGRLIVVKCRDYQGIMTRLVHFRKETASAHLERIDLPRKVTTK